jgi:hypothetical protein
MKIRLASKVAKDAKLDLDRLGETMEDAPIEPLSTHHSAMAL